MKWFFFDNLEPKTENEPQAWPTPTMVYDNICIITWNVGPYLYQYTYIFSWQLYQTILKVVFIFSISRWDEEGGMLIIQFVSWSYSTVVTLLLYGDGQFRFFFSFPNLSFPTDQWSLSHVSLYFLLHQSTFKPKFSLKKHVFLFSYWFITQPEWWDLIKRHA